MNEKPRDVDIILPFGDCLRGLMDQSSISRSDLTRLLRQRGIFTSFKDKQHSVPILMNCLLSPREFDFLKECWSTHEDNPKMSTESIRWTSDKPLIESIPNTIDLNSLIDSKFVNYSVIGTPSFYIEPELDNVIKLDFEIERRDLTKGWVTSQTKFKGSVTVRREGDRICITLTHTAPETRDIGKRLTSYLTSYFKDNGYVPREAELEKITFSSFENKGRVSFFWALTKNHKSETLDFVDVVDIEFSPEAHNRLPEEISWMQNRIEDLKLNGKSLHETFFIGDADYQQYIEVYRVDATFRFYTQGASGKCILSFEFPGYARGRDAESEMEINVSKISLDKEYKHANSSKLKQTLLTVADKAKTEAFAAHRRDE